MKITKNKLELKRITFLPFTCSSSSSSRLEMFAARSGSDPFSCSRSRIQLAMMGVTICTRLTNKRLKTSIETTVSSSSSIAVIWCTSGWILESVELVPIAFVALKTARSTGWRTALGQRKGEFSNGSVVYELVTRGLGAYSFRWYVERRSTDISMLNRLEPGGQWPHRATHVALSTKEELARHIGSK